MKVLLCIRQDYNRNFAGDSMQLTKTAEYLRKLGVRADINSGSILDYSTYDIVHLFNLTTMGETYKYYKLARQYKKNMVITPIYWDLRKYYEFVKDYESKKLWDRCTVYRAEILKACRTICVNSNIEADLLKREFNCNNNYKVIYNGVEVEHEDTPLYSLKERYSLDNYVLCVGSIGKKKNQLALAEVCNELGLTLVLIGSVSDRKYFEKCIRFPKVLYMGFMDSYNIYNAYRFSSLHVLPGFAEMPGLSTLEAAACGCNIVSTTEGCAQEYFKDKAIYCNPYDSNSIYEALSRGVKQNREPELKKLVLENYNWNQYANSLYQCYSEI